MPLSKPATGALAALLAGTIAARAEITADQLWAAWQETAEQSGQRLTGTAERAGDRLSFADAELSAAQPEGGSVTVDLGPLVFTEQGDGTVAVAYPETMPVQVVTVSEEGERIEMELAIRQSGLTLIASGEPETPGYDMTAPMIGLTLDRMTVDGEPVETTLSITAEDTSGTYTIPSGAGAGVVADLTTASVSLDMAATDPEAGTDLSLRGTLRELASSSLSSIPDKVAPGESLAETMAAGFASSGQVTHGEMAYSVETVENGTASTLGVAATGGALDYALADGAMSFDVTSKNTRLVLTGGGLPVPQIETETAETAFGLKLPLVQGAAPSDFALQLRLAGLQAGETLWSMIDPLGRLPRDPATLVLDLGGKMRWLADPTAPAPLPPQDAPAELAALEVKDLHLSAAGAELNGTGSFTFDNSRKIGPQGMPAPAGTLALGLTGGNALLDNLVAMGLIPEEQAMGVRMMVGMFARPGEGGDSLVSEIEVNEDGQIFANGQRLR